MNKVQKKNTKSINEIYIFIDLIEGYLKDLEKRLCSLEENADYDDYTNHH